VDDDLYDCETAANALSLLKCTDFPFCLVLWIRPMADILSEAHTVSKYLQSDSMNVVAALVLACARLWKAYCHLLKQCAVNQRL